MTELGLAGALKGRGAIETDAAMGIEQSIALELGRCGAAMVMLRPPYHDASETAAFHVGRVEVKG